MLINDRSIQSLQWEQEILIERRDGGLEVFSRTRQGFDALGQWYDKGMRSFRGDNGALAIYHSDFVYDGAAMRTLHLETRAGFIRPAEMEMRSAPSPQMLLGRYLDFTSYRLLGEVMQAGDELNLVENETNPSLVDLSASVVLNDKRATLVVTVDPSQGFAPCRITRRDELLDAVKEIIVTNRFAHVGDVWIPTHGSRTLFRIADLTGDEIGATRRAQEGAGLSENSDYNDPAVRRAAVDAVHSVFGGEGAPTVALGDGTMFLKVTKLGPLNEPLPESELTLDIPADARIVNVFTGSSEGKEESETRSDETRTGQRR
jgi:hypothetical protein